MILIVSIFMALLSMVVIVLGYFLVKSEIKNGYKAITILVGAIIVVGLYSLGNNIIDSEVSNSLNDKLYTMASEHLESIKK